jgi:hypothetical protein
VKLALYTGGGGTWYARLFDWLVRLVTRSPYSHCEIVIDGVCWSSSIRDGGVRAKRIDLDSGHWHVIPLHTDPARALAWFKSHMGQGYDWLGVLRFIVPFIPQRAGRWFCSEACAAALGLPCPSHYSPGGLAALIEQATTERMPT